MRIPHVGKVDLKVAEKFNLVPTSKSPLGKHWLPALPQWKGLRWVNSSLLPETKITTQNGSMQVNNHILSAVKQWFCFID